jgi:hypothetical protein
LRFVFTRRLESIPLIRSNDFRKDEESRYTYVPGCTISSSILPAGGNASKRWSFLYRKDGRVREMGLGGLVNVGLADARAKAAEARRVLGDRANRGDPLAERQKVSVAVPTFGEFARKFIESKGKGWRNEKHRNQWAMTLREYAAATLKMTDLASLRRGKGANAGS